MGLFDLLELGSGLSAGISDIKNFNKLKQTLSPNDFKVFSSLSSLGTKNDVEFRIVDKPPCLIAKQRRFGFTIQPFNLIIVLDPEGGWVQFKYLVAQGKRLVGNSDLLELMNWVNGSVKVGRMEYARRSTDWMHHETIQPAYSIDLPYHTLGEQVIPMMDAVIKNVIHFCEQYEPFFEQTNTGKLAVESDGSLSGQALQQYLMKLQKAKDRAFPSIPSSQVTLQMEKLTRHLSAKNIAFQTTGRSVSFNIGREKQTVAYFQPDGTVTIEVCHVVGDSGKLRSISDLSFFAFVNTMIARMGNFQIDHSRQLLVYRLGVFTQCFGSAVPDALVEKIFDDLEFASEHLAYLEYAGDSIPFMDIPGVYHMPSFNDIVNRVCEDLRAQPVVGEALAFGYPLLAENFRQQFGAGE